MGRGPRRRWRQTVKFRDRWWLARVWPGGRARRGTLAGMVRTGATLSDGGAEWLRCCEHERACKPSTLTYYRHTVARTMRDLGGVAVEDLTPEMLDRWKALGPERGANWHFRDCNVPTRAAPLACEAPPPDFWRFLERKTLCLAVSNQLPALAISTAGRTTHRSAQPRPPGASARSPAPPPSACLGKRNHPGEGPALLRSAA